MASTLSPLFVGLDIGTAFLRAAIADADGVCPLEQASGRVDMPAILSLGSGPRVVGEAAFEPRAPKVVLSAISQLGADAFFGDERVAPQSVVTAFAEALVGRVGEHCEQAPEAASLVVPSWLTRLGQERLQAGVEAVLPVRQCVDPATAIVAALVNAGTIAGYHAVVDYGAGGVSVAIVEVDGRSIRRVAVDGDTEAGSDRVTAALVAESMQQLADQVGLVPADDSTFASLTRLCASMVRELATRSCASRAVPFLGTDEALRLRVAREQLDVLWMDPLERLNACCRRIAKASGGIAVDSVLLVGGAAAEPLVQATVADQFNAPLGIPLGRALPAMGAATLAAATAGLIEPIELRSGLRAMPAPRISGLRAPRLPGGWNARSTRPPAVGQPSIIPASAVPPSKRPTARPVAVDVSEPAATVRSSMPPPSMAGDANYLGDASSEAPPSSLRGLSLPQLRSALPDDPMGAALGKALESGRVRAAVTADSLLNPQVVGALVPADLSPMNVFVLFTRVLARRGVAGTLLLMRDDDEVVIHVRDGQAFLNVEEYAALREAFCWSDYAYQLLPDEEPLADRRSFGFYQLAADAFRVACHQLAPEELISALGDRRKQSPAIGMNKLSQLKRLGLDAGERRIVDFAIDGSSSVEQLTLGPSRRASLILLTMLEGFGYLDWAAPETLASVELREKIALVVVTMESPNHFDALGVHSTAMPEDILAAHRSWNQRLKAGGTWRISSPDSCEIIQSRVDDAAAVLRDPTTHLSHLRQVFPQISAAALGALLERRERAYFDLGGSGENSQNMERTKSLRLEVADSEQRRAAGSV
ncbi:MAG: Hsp70 family protein [Polyangiaceae bacterium]|nr:Hsp70 family protein [Polyangiaceae bacterium]